VKQRDEGGEGGGSSSRPADLGFYEGDAHHDFQHAPRPDICCELGVRKTLIQMDANACRSQLIARCQRKYSRSPFADNNSRSHTP